MIDNFAGKTAVLTGAGSGFGLECARIDPRRQRHVRHQVTIGPGDSRRITRRILQCKLGQRLDIGEGLVRRQDDAPYPLPKRRPHDRQPTQRRPQEKEIC